MQALKRYPKALRSQKAREFSALGVATRARLRLERGPDAETVRWRALDDARGRIEREGHTYDVTGAHHWCIRRSVAGRINQKDFLLDGNHAATGGVRKMPVP